MRPYWTRNSIAAVVGLSATLTFALVGCGGDSKDAVVRVEPGTRVTTSTGRTQPRQVVGMYCPPVPPVLQQPPRPLSRKAGNAEGPGRLWKQRTRGRGSDRERQVLKDGKPSLAKDAPIKSERLVVDAATKGVKNVLVYIPKPTSVKDEAKAAASTAVVEFDQVNCVFKPHVLGVLSSGKIALKSSDPVSHNVNAKLKTNDPFNSLLSQGKVIDFKPITGDAAPPKLNATFTPG